MSAATTIEWTDQTWNPVTGCDRISPGCDNCYALTMARRLKAMGQARYQNDGDPRTSGPGFKLTIHPEALAEPLRWRKPRRVFVNSMSDLFHPAVPRDFIIDVWRVMAQCPQHTFQILTKRPKRMLSVLRSGWDEAVEFAMPPSFAPEWQHREYPEIGDTGWLPNVWLGTSIESDRYTFRADRLRGVDAAVRFLSLEPLIGALPSLDLRGIDWVIVGGESGPGARPMELEWAESLVERARAASTAVFVKQLGTVTGGRQHQDLGTFPETLQVREFPVAA